MKKAACKFLPTVFWLGVFIALSSLLWLAIYFAVQPKDALLMVGIVFICVVVEVVAFISARRYAQQRFWPGGCMLLCVPAVLWTAYSGPAALYDVPSGLAGLNSSIDSVPPLFWLVVPMLCAGALVALAWLVLGLLFVAEDAIDTATAKKATPPLLSFEDYPTHSGSMTATETEDALSETLFPSDGPDSMQPVSPMAQAEIDTANPTQTIPCEFLPSEEPLHPLPEDASPLMPSASFATQQMLEMPPIEAQQAPLPNAQKPAFKHRIRALFAKLNVAPAKPAVMPPVSPESLPPADSSALPFAETNAAVPPPEHEAVSDDSEAHCASTPPAAPPMWEPPAPLASVPVTTQKFVQPAPAVYSAPVQPQPEAMQNTAEPARYAVPLAIIPQSNIPSYLTETQVFEGTLPPTP